MIDVSDTTPIISLLKVSMSGISEQRVSWCLHMIKD